MLVRGALLAQRVRVVLRRGGLRTLKATLLAGLVVFAGSCTHVLIRPLVIGAIGERAYDEALEWLYPPRASRALVTRGTPVTVSQLTGRLTLVEDGSPGGPPRLVAVRAGDGREVLVRVDPSVGVAADHLRRRMLLGAPVTISYRQLGDVLVAVAITD